MKIKITATGATVAAGMLAAGAVVPAVLIAALVAAYAKLA